MSDWRQIHDDSIVWVLHDHFYHRLDANLALKEAGVTAKTVLPVADLAVYNDSPGTDHLAYYKETLEQTKGWAVESLVRLERARCMYESRPDRFLIATSTADVRRAKQEGKTAIFLGFEGCKAFEGRIELLHAFHRLGVRQMQLTWAYPNQLVAVEPGSGAWKLSGFGREAVAAMNDLGIVIDLSHTPRSFFDEVIRRSRHPVIVSHGGPTEPHPGSGDMTREHLDALKGCGGLLGLHFCRHYINGPFATLADFLDTIDWLVAEGYEDTIALGGDLFEDDDYFRARHPPPAGATHETWRPFIDELSDLRGLPVLTQAMTGRGLHTGTIRKILGANAMRVYGAVLGP